MNVQQASHNACGASPVPAETIPAGGGALHAATLSITEIYKSIQGESTWAGLPCIFVRLTGCHLRCVWCDTEYAFHGGTKWSIAEILARCRELGGGLVEITGGEPLLQKQCTLLARALLDEGCTVLCETSGALPIGALPADVIKIMDLKCPDSGECDKNDWSNIEALSSRDEVKFVIASRKDYEWSREVTAEHGLSKRCNAVLFSAAAPHLEPRRLVEWMLADGVDARFQMQLHKAVWPDRNEGV